YRLRCKSLWKCNHIIEGYPTEFNGETKSFSSIKVNNPEQTEIRICATNEIEVVFVVSDYADLELES
ncbi:22315_t:CDS:2, partial [Racocetra persica]